MQIRKYNITRKLLIEINSDKTIGDNENTSIATGRSALNYTDSIIGKANKVININQSQTYLDNASRLEIVKSC